MELPLFEKLMQEFEEQLETAGCFLKNDNGILGLYIAVSIATTECLSTIQAEQHIDEFFKSFNKILEGTSEEELDRIKEKRKLRTSSVDNNLEREVERNWNEIIERKYMFDRREQEELALKEIKINDLKEFFAKYISNKSNIRKLSIHVTEKDSKDFYVEKEACELIT